MTVDVLADVVRRLKSPAFVATVLCNGDVLQAAIDCGYVRVVGVTPSESVHAICAERFKERPEVRLFFSKDFVLHEIIRDINVQCTFCLDSRSEPRPSLVQEIGVLKHHRIKSHNLIIRNIDQLGHAESGFITLDQVKALIRHVDQKYRFEITGNLLVAVFG